jgi:D-alanyl-D-alanine carboxypeptidase
VLIALVVAGGVRADELDTLVAAYPQTLSGRTANRVIFRDGTGLDAGTSDSGAPFVTLLRAASIREQLLLPYPRGVLLASPDNDPGRFRSKAFFDAMYGDCRKGEVARHLVSLVWLPRSWGNTIEISSVNGIADRLKEVSAEIDALPDPVKRAAYPIAGTYACRTVADQGQPSMHAYGAAIDLNLGYSDYWLWEKSSGYRNRMPSQIVDIFERHGFIWGGKWRHFDTMHFEYRPELLPLAPAAGLR